MASMRNDVLGLSRKIAGDRDEKADQDVPYFKILIA